MSEWYRSPYDQEVRYGRKRDFNWIGYTVQLTECCDDALPHLITAVETAPATQQDHQALEAIQAERADNGLLPQQHLVDAGSISAKRILESRDHHAIELIGPVHVDPSWQVRTPGAFDVSQFQVDWQRQVVTCPQGEHRSVWHQGQDAKGESVVQVVFAPPTCQACPLRVHCTEARATGRSMPLRFPPERHELLQVARVRQQTPEFHDLIVPVSRAVWDGRHLRPNHAQHGHAPGALCRSAQDPSAASLHSPGDQSPPPRVLARRSPVCQDAHLTLCGPRCLVPSSPTVSNSRQSRADLCASPSQCRPPPFSSLRVSKRS